MDFLLLSLKEPVTLSFLKKTRNDFYPELFLNGLC